MGNKPLEDRLKNKMEELKISSRTQERSDKWIDEHGVVLAKRSGEVFAKSQIPEIRELGSRILGLSEDLLNNRYENNRHFFLSLVKVAEAYYGAEQFINALDVATSFDQFAAAMRNTTTEGARMEFEALKVRMQRLRGNILFDSTYKSSSTTPMMSQMPLDDMLRSFKRLVGKSEDDPDAIYPDHPSASFVRDVIKAVEDYNGMLGGKIVVDEEGKMRILENLVKKVPMYVFAHKDLAKRYFKQRMFNEAEREFEATLELDPRDVDALYSIALIYKKKARFLLAKHFLERAGSVLAESSYGYTNVPSTNATQVRIELGLIEMAIRRDQK